MRYLEIHPYYYDFANARSTLAPLTSAELYKPALPRVIRLDIIRGICSAVTDETLSLARLEVSDAHEDDILVSAEEAESIKKILLKENGNDLAKEISQLTSAVRDLWNLLKARLR